MSRKLVMRPMTILFSPRAYSVHELVRIVNIKRRNLIVPSELTAVCCNIIITISFLIVHCSGSTISKG